MDYKVKMKYLKNAYIKYKAEVLATLFLVVCLGISQAFTGFMADDISIRNMLSNGTVFSLTWEKYCEWEGSWLVQFVLFIIVKYAWSYKIINILMCILLVKSIASMMPGEKFRYVWSVLLFLTFPIGIVTTAGVIVTGVAYLWAAACLAYAVSIPIRIIKREKVKSIELVFGIAATLYGTNREQSGLFFLIFITAMIIYSMCTKGLKHLSKSSCIYLYLQMGLTVINFLSVVLAPGLANKKTYTIAKRYPDFATVGFGDKLYQGISATLNFFLMQKHLAVLLFAVLPAVMVWKKWKEIGVRIISIYPCIYLLCVWIKPWKQMEYLFEESEIITSQNVTRFVGYIPIILQIVWIGCVIAALYLIFENSGEFWILLFALAGGAATAAALGFTGSLYASGSRIYVFFYMVLIAVTLYLLCREKSIMESGTFILCVGGYACLNTMNYVLALIEYGGSIPHWLTLY